MTADNFANRLRRSIDHRGLTVAELSRRTCIARRTIYGLLLHDRNASAHTLKRLCVALGIDAHWLLFGEPFDALEFPARQGYRDGAD